MPAPLVLRDAAAALLVLPGDRYLLQLRDLHAYRRTRSLPRPEHRIVTPQK